MEEFKNLFSQNKSDALYIDKKEIKHRNRLTKKESYVKERQEILQKINNILNINDDNNIIYLYDIENDNDKKIKILELADDVKKYFKTGTWGFYTKDLCKDKHFLLCKSIYKDMGYDVVSKAIDITRNNNKIRTTKYVIGQIKTIFS